MSGPQPLSSSGRRSNAEGGRGWSKRSGRCTFLSRSRSFLADAVQDIMSERQPEAAMLAPWEQEPASPRSTRALGTLKGRNARQAPASYDTDLAVVTADHTVSA